MSTKPIDVADGEPRFERERATAVVRRSRSTVSKLFVYGLLALLAGTFVLSGRADTTLLGVLALAYGTDVALQLSHQWRDRR